MGNQPWPQFQSGIRERSIVNNLQDKWKEELFQCGGFLDMQIGMEPLVIDWAKEEPKMGQIIRHIYVYC